MDQHVEDAGIPSQGQNLHDLQNYLVTFNKEIGEPGDVLSSMDVVDSEVTDLYNPSGSTLAQDGGESGVSGQFSSGFYTEHQGKSSQLIQVQRSMNVFWFIVIYRKTHTHTHT